MSSTVGPYRRAVIIGGGLAGMVVANELLKQGLRVLLLEKSQRLGGKAGANLVNGVFEEHGYHVFPTWYANTLALLKEIGAFENLVPIEKFYYLVPSDSTATKGKGVYPNYIVFHQLESVKAYLKNIFSGIVPWYEASLSFYAVLDLCSQSFSHRRFLDRVSVNGFLRSRRYASDVIARYHQQTVLQASSIPNYELSAMTLKNLVHHWSAKPKPLFRIFNGNLQEKFIEPLQRTIEDKGAEIRLGTSVNRFLTNDDGVCGLEVEASGKPVVERLGEGDVCVIATPLEATRRYFDGKLFDLEEQHAAGDEETTSLGSVNYLSSAPMAAFHFYFRRKIPAIPKEHVNLFDSRFGLSFIDVSQVWSGLPNTVLSVIAADFESLTGLSEEEAARHILKDLRHFIPEIRPEDVQRIHSELNIDVPLFLNSVGAWPFRPGSRTRIANVYIAGDYCRTDADLTTMESAVISGRKTAASVLEDINMPAKHVKPIPLPKPYMIQFRIAKWLLLPGAYGLRFCAFLFARKA